MNWRVLPMSFFKYPFYPKTCIICYTRKTAIIHYTPCFAVMTRVTWKLKIFFLCGFTQGSCFCYADRAGPRVKPGSRSVCQGQDLVHRAEPVSDTAQWSPSRTTVRSQGWGQARKSIHRSGPVSARYMAKHGCSRTQNRHSNSIAQGGGWRAKPELIWTLGHIGRFCGVETSGGADQDH